MKNIKIITTVFVLSAFGLLNAVAATVDFSGTDFSGSGLWSGQNYSYTVGSGPETGTVNVSGGHSNMSGQFTLQDVSSIDLGLTVVGSQKDDVVSLYYFFDTARTFIITENGLLNDQRINDIHLFDDASWTLLSSPEATVTENASDWFTFQGTNQGLPENPAYSLMGTATGFSVQVRRSDPNSLSPDYPTGSISLNVVPEPSTWAMLGAGLAFLGVRRIRRVGM